jgi:hypothetical protein
MAPTPYMIQRGLQKNGKAKTAAEEKREAKPKPIAKKSAKRKELDKEYAEVSRPLWKGQDCQAKLQGCTGKAQGMHHLEGKENADKLLNMKKAIPCCNHCNGEIERLHGKAVDLGLKEKRNTPTKRYDKTYKKKP